MQTKLVNNHDSMRLDIMADTDKKTFIRFGFGRYRTKLTLRGKIEVTDSAHNNRNDIATIEHVRPKSLGGTNYDERLVSRRSSTSATCSTSNRTK